MALHGVRAVRHVISDVSSEFVMGIRKYLDPLSRPAHRSGHKLGRSTALEEEVRLDQV